MDDVIARGPLESALALAVSHAEWLKPSDGAAVELAAAYARRIDQGTSEFLNGELSSSDFNKVLYLGPHLLNTLKSVGLTPEERQSIMGATAKKAEVDPLDELKARRQRKVERKSAG